MLVFEFAWNHKTFMKRIKYNTPHFKHFVGISESVLNYIYENLKFTVEEHRCDYKYQARSQKALKVTVKIRVIIVVFIKSDNHINPVSDHACHTYLCLLNKVVEAFRSKHSRKKKDKICKQCLM